MRAPWALSFLLLALSAPPAMAMPLRDRVVESINPSQWQTVPESGRRYWLHVPAASTLMPLVIVLHGFGVTPEEQEQISGFSQLAEREGFAVAYPLGEGDPPQWQFMGKDDRDEKFIRAVVEDVAQHHAIDWQRIYLAGISNGAQMSARMGCIAPDLFAAIGLVAGNYMGYSDCRTDLPLPAILFHGTADTTLRYDGRFVQFSPQHWAETRAAQNGCAAMPAVTFSQHEVTAQSWQQCRDDADVVFYSIIGKGHSWPGSTMPAAITTQTINATTLMWDFFRPHQRL